MAWISIQLSLCGCARTNHSVKTIDCIRKKGTEISSRTGPQRTEPFQRRKPQVSARQDKHNSKLFLCSSRLGRSGRSCACSKSSTPSSACSAPSTTFQARRDQATKQGCHARLLARKLLLRSVSVEHREHQTAGPPSLNKHHTSAVRTTTKQASSPRLSIKATVNSAPEAA